MTKPTLPARALARFTSLLVLSLACASPSHATSNLANAFTARYPASGTRAAAGCNTCHAGSTSVNSLNAYGRDLHAAAAATAALRLAAIEGVDSDKESHSNLVEINASTQPGWCVATTPGCDNNGATPPSALTALDPPATNQPPVARPGGPYNGTLNTAIAFSGTASSDPDGSIASYAWNFGDGSTGSGPTPSHSYTGVGAYTVTLTVTDNGGLTNAATTTATVSTGSTNQAPVARAGGPYNGTVNVAIAFSGAASSDPDGSIAGYSWSFGDGSTGSGATPSHSYSAAGTYTVTLTVTDNGGLTNSATTTATVSPASTNQPPVARPGGPYNGTLNTAIAFSGTASSDPDGTIASYAWNFGDGSTGSGATPSHSYTGVGTYTVTLTVTDNGGLTNAATTTATVSTGSTNQPPVARPGGPYSGTVNATVSFNGSGSSDPDGNVVSYDWQFGDGGTASGAQALHTYATAGTYTVTLTVTDDAGLTASATTTVTVTAAANDGATLYALNCADCHGDPWSGPAVDAALSGTKRVTGARSCTIHGAIFGTSVFPGGVHDMVTYGNQSLSTTEIDAIAGYLNSRDVSGEQRYVTACAGCHGNDARGGRTGERVTGAGSNSIHEGIREVRAMQYLDCMTDGDVNDVSAYLKSLPSSGDDSSGGDDGGGGGAVDIVLLLGAALLGLVRAARRATAAA